MWFTALRRSAILSVSVFHATRTFAAWQAVWTKRRNAVHARRCCAANAKTWSIVLIAMSISAGTIVALSTVKFAMYVIVAPVDVERAAVCVE